MPSSTGAQTDVPSGEKLTVTLEMDIAWHKIPQIQTSLTPVVITTLMVDILCLSVKRPTQG